MAALQDKTCLMIHQLRTHAAGPALIDGLSRKTAKLVRSSEESGIVDMHFVCISD